VSRFEQEPISAFRRDVVADDEFRIRVEEIVADLLHEERVMLAWAVRRILGQTYVSARPVFRGFDVILQASDVLRAGRG
jgi:hypothetical protein